MGNSIVQVGDNTNDHAMRLLTTSRYPIWYLAITKCGCTFVKNVLWYLEHGREHTNPRRIHGDDDQLLRVSALPVDPDEIRYRGFAFTCIRNPADRLFSLYADKVVGDGYRYFPPLRQVLTDKYGLNPEAVTVEEHAGNFEILTSWVERNLGDHVDLKRNPHWTPQHFRHRAMKQLDLKILLVNHLSNQLRILLEEVVPDLPPQLMKLEKNRHSNSLPKGEILTRELRRRVNRVYQRDRDFFLSARDHWRKLKNDTMTCRDIPRYSTIIAKQDPM